MSRALYSALEWVTRFAYIQLLWITFTIFGAVILGLFPATIAMFSVIRQWLKGQTDLPILNTFLKYYKEEFWKSNRIGFFIYCIAFIFLFNIFFLYTNIGEILTWTSVPLIAGVFIFLLFLFYLFPTYVHFHIKGFQVLKYSFFTMLISPLQSFLIVVSLASFYFLTYLLPALFFIFGASFYAFITVHFAIQAFNKFDKQTT
ncbi:YesL family protein [Alkalibacillus haloalkaliphilus]|uniref:YesL family protein n=1 Tax=Alkalibacillus haloalkaliphilus TaxID=94136 RepID=UPI0011BD877C|nr:DUF624 domain-containing protein [Alkalibacillus haloalkaliphilus]